MHYYHNGKPWAFAAQTPEFSISVEHGFLTRYGNLVTDIDLYQLLGQKAGSAYCQAEKLTISSWVLPATLSLSSISWPTSFFIHWRHAYTGKPSLTPFQLPRPGWVPLLSPPIAPSISFHHSLLLACLSGLLPAEWLQVITESHSDVVWEELTNQISPVSLELWDRCFTK